MQHCILLLLFKLYTDLATSNTVAYVPNLFGEESILVIGGGKYDTSTNAVTEEEKHMLAYRIKRTNNAAKPLEFEKTMHKDWSRNFSPYVQAIADKIVVVQGGEVRKNQSKIYDNWAYKMQIKHNYYFTKVVIFILFINI